MSQNEKPTAVGRGGLTDRSSLPGSERHEVSPKPPLNQRRGYPDEPGFKGDPNGPGADAARRYKAQVGRRQQQVLDGLGAGPKNAEQIGLEIGLHWYLVRPRLSELERKGLVAKTG